MILHGAPMCVKLLEDGAAARSIEKGGDVRRLNARRAAGNGEGEAVLDGIEMGVLREGELELVAEGCAGGGVEESPCGRLLGGLLHCLATLSQGEVRTGVEGREDVVGKRRRALRASSTCASS